MLGVAHNRRMRRESSNLLTLDMVSSLRRMIAQAKRDLFLARCLYAGAPLGAVISYLVASMAGVSRSPLAAGGSQMLHDLQTAAGVAALLAMMLTGILLERARRTQVENLNRKLKSMTEDL
ncbi:MAG: hypothetical protein QM757_41090 [Paludibaculum sp.]